MLARPRITSIAIVIRFSTMLIIEKIAVNVQAQGLPLSNPYATTKCAIPTGISITPISPPIAARKNVPIPARMWRAATITTPAGCDAGETGAVFPSCAVDKEVGFLQLEQNLDVGSFFAPQYLQ